MLNWNSGSAQRPIRLYVGAIGLTAGLLFVLLFAVAAIPAVHAQQRALQATTFDWVAAFGGPDAGAGYSIALDEADNVYTTGYFDGAFDFGGSADPTPIGQRDIFVAKQGADGTLNWVKAMGSTNTDRGRGVAIGSDGAVYVIGHFRQTADFDPDAGTVEATSAGADDIFVLKLDGADGSLDWVQTFGAPAQDYGLGIAVDNADNVYMTGFFSGTVDFDPAPGPGNQEILTSAAEDIFVSSLTSEGAFRWARRVDGPGGDNAESIAVDDAGNVYVTGFFRESGTNFNPGGDPATPPHDSGTDIFLMKYNAAGNFQWVRAMGSSGSDVGHAVTTDNGGNVYVAGAFQGSVDFDPGTGQTILTNEDGSEDGFVAAFRPNGDFLWANQAKGTGEDEATDVAVDGSGRVYVSGFFNGPVELGNVTLNSAAGVDNVFAAIYSTSGGFLSADRIGGDEEDTGPSITADSSNGVYVTGAFSGQANFDPNGGAGGERTSQGATDIFVVKLTTDVAAPAGSDVYLPVVANQGAPN